MPKHTRDDLLEKIVEALLRDGLGAASLRPLAKAVGTSDRMLLYYFKDKADLLSAAFGAIAGRLMVELEVALPPGETAPPAALLTRLGAITRGDSVRRAMQLWIELVAAAGRGEEPHRTVASAILDGFLVWIESRLPEDFLAGRPAGRRATAAAILACIDGAALLRALGRDEAADLALEAAAARFVD